MAGIKRLSPDLLKALGVPDGIIDFVPFEQHILNPQLFYKVPSVLKKYGLCHGQGQNFCLRHTGSQRTKYLVLLDLGCQFL